MPNFSLKGPFLNRARINYFFLVQFFRLYFFIIVDYEQMQEFNKLVMDKGAYALEAPITGGLEALKKGQMTVFIAGDAQISEHVSFRGLP